MKHPLLALLAATLFLFDTSAQDNLPEVKIKKLNGTEIMASSIANEGKPIILSFWSTRCSPCIQELDAISNVYSSWKKETNVKVVIISTDDSRSYTSVKGVLSGRGWEFECYLDVNQNLQRAMNVTVMPHTIILNGKGQIVYTHLGYSPGSENSLYKVVKTLL